MTTISITENAAKTIQDYTKDAESLKQVVCEAFTELASDDIVADPDPDSFHRHDNIRAALLEFSHLLTGLMS